MPTATPLSIQFLPFELQTFAECLQLKAPVLSDPKQALRQLTYVARYAQDLNCKCLVIERPYVDRDYVEDHSVFYSKCLYPYPNYCTRIHFFLGESVQIESMLNDIVDIGVAKGIEDYKAACRKFSDEAYLGFSVIKPLHGCPVGRTVLRSFPAVPENAEDKSRRKFGGTRDYQVHLLGAELIVRGLAFQQQDVGVSACATTAIWSSLHKMRDHEDIAAFTPAQITSLASKYSLPFGRAMPSEGLSIDQMCQAIQAVGLAPNILRVHDIANARGFLHAAVESGLAPIVILKYGTSNSYHAVTVAGMKYRTPPEASLIQDETDDLAGNVIALYVHDDRRGPYLRANLAEKEKRPMLNIPSRDNETSEELWEMTHILIPIHSKIRLSISGLRHSALEAVASVHQCRELIERQLDSAIPLGKTVSFASRFLRTHKYIELMMAESGVLSQSIRALCSKVTFPRYVGIVRLAAPYLGTIDLLIDTTSTQRNAHCLGVFVVRENSVLTTRVARFLAGVFQCENIA